MDINNISEFLKLPTEYLKQFTQEEIELVYLAIGKLDMRFKNKIDFDKYYLSYSGGRDSHLLYWFIKEWLKDDKIKIVGLNTYREYNEIRERIYKYSDTVLYPKMLMKDINDKYGMPCFTKEQDFFIGYYQKAKREGREIPKSYKDKIENDDLKFNVINKKAKQMVISGELHMVSHHCCTYTKKKPFEEYEKITKTKAILGIRQGESQLRATQYQSCLSKNGKFTPIYDFTDEMLLVLEKIYNIHIPKIYNTVNRSGCLGCIYGKKDVVLPGLSLATKPQIKYAIDSFYKSYKVKDWYDDIIKIYNSK